MVYFHFRCAIPKTREILMEQVECLFYQSHPVAHAGMEFDHLDDALAANLIGGYTTIYKLKDTTNRIQISVNGAIMSDGYILKRNRYDKDKDYLHGKVNNL